MASANRPSKVIRDVFRMPWTIAVGVLVGLLIAPAGQSWWLAALRYYDEIRPVVRMDGWVVSRAPDAVVVTFSGEKLRECVYLRLQAYAVTASGTLEDAYIRREDMEARGDTKPLGTFSIGYWRIWPVAGAKAVRVYVQHDCGGRLVQTRFGELPLTQPTT